MSQKDVLELVRRTEFAEIQCVGCVLKCHSVKECQWQCKENCFMTPDEILRIVTWLNGFIDGEGTFGVGLRQEKTSKWGIRARISFQLTQSRKDKFLLAKLLAFFGVGRLHESTAEVFELVVDSQQDISDQIVPLLKSINLILLTRKQLDFADWLKIYDLLVRGSASQPTVKGGTSSTKREAKQDGLSLENLVQIVLIANNMNKFRYEDGYQYLPDAYTLLLKAEHPCRPAWVGYCL